MAYNEAKSSPSYLQDGPINAKYPFPIMAGWDDHDFGYDDCGSEYPCKHQTQVHQKDMSMENIY